MDPTLKVDDVAALTERIDRYFKLIELHRQLQAPPPPPIWQTWFVKAWPGIIQSVLIDTLWPIGFWWESLRFCFTRPFSTRLIVKGIFKMYFKDEWTADAAREYIDALLVFSGYLTAHLLQKISTIRHPMSLSVLGRVLMHGLLGVRLKY